MRIFIAIPLPSRIRKELAKIEKEFASFPAKWVEEKNLHITLVFIGSIKPDHNLPVQYHTLAYETQHGSSKLGEIAEYVGKGMAGFPPIKLKIDKLMLFPNEKKARLLTTKLEGDPTSPRLRGAGTGELIALVEKIKDGLRARRVGFDEKPFHPHITLARLKKLRSDQKKELRKRVQSYNLPKIGFETKRVELIESKLTPTGPVYEMLATTTLIEA